MPGAGAAKLRALHGLDSLRFAILSGALPISSSNDGINIPHFSAPVNRSERGTHLFLEKHKNIAAGEVCGRDGNRLRILLLLPTNIHVDSPNCLCDK